MANEDFLAVQNFKKPIYARPVDYAADGGTIVYKGQGYFIEVRKSIETQNLDQPNEVQGYIYGPRIIYGAKNEKGINYEKQDLKFYPAQVLRDLLDKNRADKN